MPHPVAIDALANWSSRTSRCDRNTDDSGSEPPRQSSTNTRSLSIFVSRSARPGCRHGRIVVGDEPTRVVEQAAMDELGDRVDEPRPADPYRLDVPDHVQRDAIVGRDLDAFDRALRRPHPAPDLRRLERRPGRRRGRDHALVRAERDLAVRADVDEQPQTTVPRQTGCQHPGDDVPSDVRAERREHERRAPADARKSRSRARARRRTSGSRPRTAPSKAAPGRSRAPGASS